MRYALSAFLILVACAGTPLRAQAQAPGPTAFYGWKTYSGPRGTSISHGKHSDSFQCCSGWTAELEFSCRTTGPDISIAVMLPNSPQIKGRFPFEIGAGQSKWVGEIDVNYYPHGEHLGFATVLKNDHDFSRVMRSGYETMRGGDLSVDTKIPIPQTMLAEFISKCQIVSN